MTYFVFSHIAGPKAEVYIGVLLGEEGEGAAGCPEPQSLPLSGGASCGGEWCVVFARPSLSPLLEVQLCQEWSRVLPQLPGVCLWPFAVGFVVARERIVTHIQLDDFLMLLSARLSNSLQSRQHCSLGESHRHV